MQRRIGNTGFTLIETLIAMGMVAMVMAFTGLLFHRSFQILRVLDDKERARQAARMGLDRIMSELREATLIIEASSELEFEKIDPTRKIIEPAAIPEDPPNDFVPPPYGPAQAYPDNNRLIVRYEIQNENLVRRVKRKTGGAFQNQVVVAGVNAFTCTETPGNEGEVKVEVSVRDNRRVLIVSGRVLCICIREEFD